MSSSSCAEVRKSAPPAKWIVSEKRLSRKTGHVPQPRKLRLAQPHTAAEVRECVRQAARKKKTVVCVGARHSFSDLDRLSGGGGGGEDRVWMLRMHFTELDDDVQTQNWRSVAEYREGLAERLIDLQHRQKRLRAAGDVRTPAEDPFHTAFIGSAPFLSTHLRRCALHSIAGEPVARHAPPKRGQPPLSALQAEMSCPVVRRHCLCGLEHYVVRVGASVPLSALHVWLEAQRLSLPNTGQVAHQSVAGAVSTATHGSGPFPPLSSLVLAVELVDDRGRLHRIEPGPPPQGAAAGAIAGASCFSSSEPTEFDDPERLREALAAGGGFPAGEVVVHRDDEYFRTAVVNLGCLGCVTAVTLLVQDLVFLREQRLRRKWKQVRQDLLRGQFLPHLPAMNDHLRASTSAGSVLDSTSLLTLDFSQHSLLGSFDSDSDSDQERERGPHSPGSRSSSSSSEDEPECYQNDAHNFGCLPRPRPAPVHDPAPNPHDEATTPPCSPLHSPRDASAVGARRVISPRGPRDHTAGVRTRVHNRNFEFFVNPYNMSCMKIVRHEILLDSESNDLPDEDRLRSMTHHLSHAPLFTRLVREVSSLRVSSGELWIDILLSRCCVYTCVYIW
jgi:FAD binding domain